MVNVGVVLVQEKRFASLDCLQRNVVLLQNFVKGDVSFCAIQSHTDWHRKQRTLNCYCILPV